MTKPCGDLSVAPVLSLQSRSLVASIPARINYSGRQAGSFALSMPGTCESPEPSALMT